MYTYLIEVSPEVFGVIITLLEQSNLLMSSCDLYLGFLYRFVGLSIITVNVTESLYWTGLLDWTTGDWTTGLTLFALKINFILSNKLPVELHSLRNGTYLHRLIQIVKG